MGREGEMRVNKKIQGSCELGKLRPQKLADQKKSSSPSKWLRRPEEISMWVEREDSEEDVLDYIGQLWLK